MSENVSEIESEKTLKAPRLGAFRALGEARNGGKKFKGFTSMAKYRQGINRAIRYLQSPKGKPISKRIMEACMFSGDQHRAVLDVLIEMGFLRERENYKRGQSRYMAGPKLEEINQPEERKYA